MSEQVWVQEPPPPNASGTPGKYDWDTIVEAIKQRPGEWLLVEQSGGRGLAVAIRNRKMRALKDPAWKFTAQVRKNQGSPTWATYISAERIDPNGG